jgi:hypothetical protein
MRDTLCISMRCTYSDDMAHDEVSALPDRGLSPAASWPYINKGAAASDAPVFSCSCQTQAERQMHLNYPHSDRCVLCLSACPRYYGTRLFRPLAFCSSCIRRCSEICQRASARRFLAGRRLTARDIRPLRAKEQSRTSSKPENKPSKSLLARRCSDSQLVRACERLLGMINKSEIARR